MSAIGKNIDSYCLKCKLMLAHVVMSQVDGAISKVKCNTCGAEHKYRAKIPGVKKSNVRSQPTLKEAIAKRAAVAKIDANNAPLQWDIRNRGMDNAAPVKDYSIHNQYRARDVINHQVFGLGFVERIVSDKSMDVLFRDSVKLMAMNISS